MRISYNKLWDLMKKNKMKKTDLAKAAEGNKAAAARARKATLELEKLGKAFRKESIAELK